MCTIPNVFTFAVRKTLTLVLKEERINSWRDPLIVLPYLYVSLPRQTLNIKGHRMFFKLSYSPITFMDDIIFITLAEIRTIFR